MQVAYRSAIQPEWIFRVDALSFKDILFK